MSVEFASLVAEVDSTSAVSAKQALLDFASAAGVAEGAAQRLKGAATHALDSGSVATATRELSAYRDAQISASRASQATASASSELQRLRALEATQNKDAAAQLKAAAAETAKFEREQARATKTAEAYVRQVNAIERALDPLAGVQQTLATRTATLDKALASGAISLDRHARLTSQAAKAAEGGAASLNKMGASTKLAAHELTNLGYQAQDVFVSLASGQNPFLVLAQQGSQISQVLGSSRAGFGGALKELGGIALSVLGKAGPIAIGVGTLGLLAVAFIKGSTEAAAFENALTSTGNYAGITAGQYEDMAKRISDATGKSVRDSKSGISELVASGRYSAATIEAMVEVSQRYAELTGKTTQESLKDYASMADGVTKWAVKHTLAHHDLSLAQIDRIAELDKAGKAEEAYQLALAGIQDSVESRAAPAYGLLQRLLRDTGRAASDMWDAILGVGRPKTIEQQIGEVQARVQSRDQGGLDAFSRYGLPGVIPGLRGDDFKAKEQGDRDLLRGLQLDKKFQEDQAAAAARAAQAEAAKIDKKYGSGAKAAPKGPRDASEQAVDAAIKAELAARQALTHNVEALADIKRDEVQAELAAQKNRLDRSVKEGSVTRAAAEIASGKHAEAAAQKIQLINMEEAADIAQRELAQRQAISNDLDRLAAIQASMAGSAEEAGRIELSALDRRQALDRDTLAEKTKQQVIYGEITDRAAAELTISQLALQQVERKQAARNAELKSAEEATSLAQAELDARGAGVEAAIMLSKSSYERSVLDEELLAIQQEIARLTAEQAVRMAVEGSTAQRIAQLQLQGLTKRQEAERALASNSIRLVDAIEAAADGVYSFKNAIKRHNWSRVFDEFVGTLATIQRAFETQGLSGGLSATGSAAAALVGGKTGRVAGTALGIAGLGVSAGAFLSSGAGLAAAGGIGGAVAGVGGAAGVAAGAGIANGLVALGAVAAPIAIAAAALYAAAKIFNLGGKPTNAGAGYDLVTGQLSGKSRTSETEQAATAAGEAIKSIEEALKGAGIGLTDSVKGLVIGTRDVSQIYLASGKTLTSAVGDSGAAIDTAMKALLDGATYVSDAQKKLVDSALAAGQGFDKIAEILAAYEVAQSLSKGLADEILQLTDPKAYDLQAVKRDAEEQRKAAKAAADAGYLTADQLATINAQLGVLEGLKIDEVMERYGSAVQGAADLLDDAKAATESARGDLRDAYDREAAALQSTIDGLKQTSAALKGFRKELDYGALAGRDPVSQYAAVKAEFDRLSSLAPDNVDRLANLQSVGQAFIEASKAASPTSLAFDRDLNAVRRAVEASQVATNSQVDAAEAQLEALTTQVGLLINLNEGVLTVAQAIANLQAALAAEQAAGGGSAANDNLDVAAYLAANPDLAANFNAGGSLRGVAATLEEAARLHYQTTGQYEIAAGQRNKFATGGSFTVEGEATGDQVPVNIMANGGEVVNISRRDNMERVSLALERQNALLIEQNRLLSKGNFNTARAADVLVRVTPDGDALKVAS